MKDLPKRLLPLLCLASFPGLMGDDWPQFRGPHNDGVSRETGWSKDWKASPPKVAWRAELGIGFSAFSVVGDHAVSIGHQEGHEVVTCLDAATGKVRWTHRFPSDLGAKFYIGGPGSTPSIDTARNRVYVLGKWGEVFCLGLEDGAVVWTRRLAQEEDIKIPTWGFSGSPLLWKDRLFLNCGRSGLALDPGTGSTAWKSEGVEAGYSTPMPYSANGAAAVVFSSGEGYSAVSPETGEEIWSIAWPTRYGVNAADPIVTGGKVFVSSGYGKGSGLFALGGGKLAPLWEERLFRNQQNAAVRIGGHLYGIDGNSNSRAKLKCVSWESGDVLWEEETGYGAVSAAGSHLIYITAGGRLGLAEASPERFRPLGSIEVLGPDCWTVPVLSNGRIFCRNSKGSAVALDVKL